MMAQNRLFCFGLGYSALALADLLRPRGWRIAGTCRSEEKRAALAAMGLETFLFDRGRPLADPGTALAGTTHLLSSVPPDATGDPVIDQHGTDLRQLRGIQWTGYLSTTGVYGDRQGAWVDETAPLTPSGPRGQRRLEAERAWLALGSTPGSGPAHLFRLAGIYGPGRSAIDTVREGRARRIDKPGQVFSRIHVDDIATVLLASIDRPNPGAAYNVCDDDPAAPAVVIEEACKLLGVASPPVESFNQAKATMSAMAISFYDDNKRVRNDRIKGELGIVLKYPTYREGLRAVLAAS